MKYNKTLKFDGSRAPASSPSDGRRRVSAAKLEHERQSYKQLQLAGPHSEALDPRLAASQEYSSSFVGLAGVFIPIQTDFTSNRDSQSDAAEAQEAPANSDAKYSDATHWPSQKREKVKRVRFIICVLALMGLALGVMSRLMLNVSIVEMVRHPEEVPGEELAEDGGQQQPPASSTEAQDLSSLIFSNDPIDQLMLAAELGQGPGPSTTTPDALATAKSEPPDGPAAPGEPEATSELPASGVEDDGLHFDWTQQDVNTILGSLYLGYMPGILFSGHFVQRYGAKVPMFVCLLGTGLVNLLTPTIARFSLTLLICSRVLLGLIQGSLLPALYELFNRWLTQTEANIFAPMIKVSIPLGSLVGTLMPGLLARFQLQWPALFYLGGAACLVWSLVWLLVATSVPHTNRFIEQTELNRIMRKKSAAFKMVEATLPSHHKQSGDQVRRRSSASAPNGGQTELAKQAESQAAPKQQQPTRRATPWLKIATNPSVLALTLVKFTYNIGLDFVMIQLAVYLREVHSAPIGTISLIAGSAYCMQMLLILFVGWTAKVVVLNRALGLSVTKWRKLFQGGSNFLMAAAYVLLAYLDPSIEVATCLVIAVAFFWMLGAGGESMVPYDLSRKFPASIVGLTHSVSILSGVSLPTICAVVLGEDTHDSSRWSVLFYILAALLSVGGLVFVCVLKAKPFLPGERQTKANNTNNNGKPAAAQSISAARAAKEREASQLYPQHKGQLNGGFS